MARANYNARKNPFNLSAPPTWWLRELAAFDADLVVLPSLTRPEYLLARHARRSGGIKPLVQTGLAAPHPNTLRLAELKLVPVATITPKPNRLTWTRIIFDQLAERDLWRHGGANRVARQVEDQEQSAEAKRRRNTLDDCDALSGESYRGWQYRSGLRVSMAAPSKRPAVPKPASRRPVLPKQVSGPVIVVPGAPQPRSRDRAPLIVAP